MVIRYIVGNYLTLRKFSKSFFGSSNPYGTPVTLTEADILKSLPKNKSLIYFSTKKEAEEYCDYYAKKDPEFGRYNVEFQAIFTVGIYNVRLERQLRTFLESTAKSIREDGRFDLCVIYGSLSPSEATKFSKQTYVYEGRNAWDKTKDRHLGKLHYIDLFGIVHRVQIYDLEKFDKTLRELVPEASTKDYFNTTLSVDEIHILVTSNGGFVAKDDTIAPKITSSDFSYIVSTQVAGQQFKIMPSFNEKCSAYSELLPKLPAISSQYTLSELLPLIKRYCSSSKPTALNLAKELENAINSKEFSFFTVIARVQHQLAAIEKTGGDYYAMLQTMIEYLEQEEVYLAALLKETGLQEKAGKIIYEYALPGPAIILARP